MFNKHIILNKQNGFVKDSFGNNKQWFDGDCKKRNYTDALNLFNHCKTDENRINLCTMKNVYKGLVKRKRKLFKAAQCKRIEQLRFSKPILQGC